MSSKKLLHVSYKILTLCVLVSSMYSPLCVIMFLILNNDKLTLWYKFFDKYVLFFLGERNMVQQKTLFTKFKESNVLGSTCVGWFANVPKLEFWISNITGFFQLLKTFFTMKNCLAYLANKNKVNIKKFT